MFMNGIKKNDPGSAAWGKFKRRLLQLFRDDWLSDWEMIDQHNRMLLVGLGNPGKKYENNRHNLGFMAVDRLANAYQIPMNRVQHKSIIGQGQIAETSVIIAKPQTYMNDSGTAVGSLARYYKISDQQVLVIFDELDLPFGMIRLRKKGGAGGHNGMKSIIQNMGQDFPRLRIGIGRPPGRMDPASFVLKDFHPDELPEVDEILERTRKAIESFIVDGIDLAMTYHNN